MLVPEMQHFNMKREHGIILSIIFFKNYCMLKSLKVSKETALKFSYELKANNVNKS